MASIIKIKRSGNTAAPTALAAGELAYSWFNGTNKLYIGTGTETGGEAANIDVIGGKFFTDLLDHTPGTLTASSAVIVDANSKIDVFNVDNLRLDGNTLSATDLNGNLLLSANGTGKVKINDSYFLPAADGGADQFIKTDGAGNLSFAAIPSGSFDLAGNSGTDTFTTGQTLTITGSGAISTAITDNTVTISVTTATDDTLGVASFDATDFTVTAGAVTLNAERVEDIVGGMLTGTGATQSGIAVGYDDANGKLTFNVNDPVITIAGDVDGSATMTDLGNTTITVTLDTVNANVGTFGSSTVVPVITVNGKGLVTGVTTANLTTNFNIAADAGTTDSVSLGGTLTFTGTDPVQTTVTDNTITISVDDATTTTKGIASFSADNFAVTAGAVTIKDGGVSNAELVNSAVTIGSTTVSLGATSTSLAGLTEVTVDNININGNEITSTNLNGNISLNPNGTGSVDVNGATITGVGTPVNSTDAANKAYVDNAVTGLTFKEAVELLATTNVALTGSTATLVIDGHAALDQADDGIYRLLLTGQTTDSENGIYVYTDNGTSYTLVRAADADTFGELDGASVFVKEGVTYANTGWVQTNHYLTDFTGQDWVQFSGAGAYVAGDGLTQTGTTFNVGAGNGITVSADTVSLATTVAGNGLTYTNGVLDVVGTTNRITVSADAIDIASTYVGQTSITTLGTITTGTWNGTTIATTSGGTGLTSYATGDLLYASATNTLSKLTAGLEGTVLQINASGVPVWGNIDGGTY